MFILYFLVIVCYIILSIIFRKKKYYNKTPFKNIWSSKSKLRLLSIVEVVHNICKSNNIILIPMYKTLLGIYKYKDILPWHGCFELIIAEKDFDYLINIFRKDSYGISYTKREIKIFEKNKKWPYVSITKYNYNPKEYTLQEKDLFPTYIYKFSGILLNMPNNTENILNNLYNNWKTECTSSDFDYKEQKLYCKTFNINWEELYYKKDNISFENTWVINLDRCKNRWNTTKTRLKNLGITPKRWKATDKNSKEIENLYKNLKGINIGMNTGTVACYLSHKRLWEYLYSIEVPYAIIFEDDIIFNKSIKDISKIFKDSIGFNIIFLGYTCPNRPVFINQYVTEGGGTCLHAYIISRKGLKNLLELKHDFTNPVDKITKKFAEDNLCYISKHDTEGKNYGYGIIQQDNNIESDLRLRFNIFGNTISL